MPSENALFVQLGVSPTSSISGAMRDANSELLPVQLESEQPSTSYGGDALLDSLERDDAAANTTMESLPRRRRDAPTQADAEQSQVPFVLSSVFVRNAVDAALVTQGIQSSLERLDGLTSRSRTSSLLPELRFRAGRDADQSLRLAPTADEPYRYTQSGGVSFIVEGQATFRLNRLLFANEELGIERLRLMQARERQRITDSLLEELLVWQKVYRIMADTTLASSRALTQLRESSLRLDVMTGGWFSAHEPVLPREARPAPAAESRGVPRIGELTAPITPAAEPSLPVMPKLSPAYPGPSRTGGPRQAELSVDRVGNWSRRGALVKLSTSR